MYRVLLTMYINNTVHVLFCCAGLTCMCIETISYYYVLRRTMFMFAENSGSRGGEDGRQNRTEQNRNLSFYGPCIPIIPVWCMVLVWYIAASNKTASAEYVSVLLLRCVGPALIQRFVSNLCATRDPVLRT